MCVCVRMFMCAFHVFPCMCLHECVFRCMCLHTCVCVCLHECVCMHVLARVNVVSIVLVCRNEDVLLLLLQ